jgi:hypothetical protein
MIQGLGDDADGSLSGALAPASTTAQIRKETLMKKNRIIRLSGVALILASAGVMVDAFDLVRPDVAIGTMFFAMLFGSSGLVVFLWRAAGRWAAGLGLLGVLLILGSNLLYPSDAFAWMFALGLLSVGIALFPAGVLARLASILWLVAAAMGLPPMQPVTNGSGFLVFGLALLSLGYTLSTQAGPREVAIA